MDYPLYERIRQLRERFDQITRELGGVDEGVSDSVVESEVSEAVKSVRKKARRRR